MNLLIDTHLLLWSAFAPAKVPARAAELMLDPAHQLWFSAASIWEVAIKRGLDRPDFRVEPGFCARGFWPMTTPNSRSTGVTASR
ncbi:type II toxin-antitoxin system VapC family toxin [Paracoccus cavernae]|uniref:type II toxin-antitoxin system VapC family toxin n=1 Tax=Paracoccus cavernae TaxID=1571207 RepID=UPI00362C5CED